jgi:hypothetical protein
LVSARSLASSAAVSALALIAAGVVAAYATCPAGGVACSVSWFAAMAGMALAIAVGVVNLVVSKRGRAR